MSQNNTQHLLEVKDLKVEFSTEDGLVRSVDGLNFHIDKGETLGIVGESGSGKSVTSLSIMGLLDMPPGRISNGEILFQGRDILKIPESEMRTLRGSEMAMIFQEPMTSLNPVYTVGEQISETIRLHQKLNRKAAWTRAADMLELLGIPDPLRRLDSYPHQLSGGMRQRIMIAMALSCNPSLLIADEPTTALDVTIQAQILDLIRALQKEFGMAVLFITHDLGVVAEMADRVVVMYGGRAVEENKVEQIFASPKMPYTAALMKSIPRLGYDYPEGTGLYSIPGNVPSPLSLPCGCAFNERCEYKTVGICDQDVPPLVETGDGGRVRCARWEEVTGSLSYE